eukprot:355289-Pelagomonas_calceolata.AAC.2
MQTSTTHFCFGSWQLQERLRDPRSYGALSLLVDEAGFLTDAKAKAVMERLPKAAGSCALIIAKKENELIRACPRAICQGHQGHLSGALSGHVHGPFVPPFPRLHVRISRSQDCTYVMPVCACAFMHVRWCACLSGGKLDGSIVMLCSCESFLQPSTRFGTFTHARAQTHTVQDEAGLVAAESIVRALGVVDGISFDTLMDALSADSNIEVKAKVRWEGEGCTQGKRKDATPSLMYVLLPSECALGASIRMLSFRICQTAVEFHGPAAECLLFRCGAFAGCNS